MRIFLHGVLLLGISAVILAACAGEQPKNLGARDGVLAECPSSPNCVQSQTRTGGEMIAPLTFSGDADAAFARLRMLLELRSDTTIVAAQKGYLQVEFRTVFFVDDGEFLLDRKSNVIHVRSASRIGYSDLGKNRRRLEAIRQEFGR